MGLADSVLTKYPSHALDCVCSQRYYGVSSVTSTHYRKEKPIFSNLHFREIQTAKSRLLGRILVVNWHLCAICLDAVLSDAFLEIPTDNSLHNKHPNVMCFAFDLSSVSLFSAFCRIPINYQSQRLANAAFGLSSIQINARCLIAYFISRPIGVTVPIRRHRWRHY